MLVRTDGRRESRRVGPSEHTRPPSTRRRWWSPAGGWMRRRSAAVGGSAARRSAGTCGPPPTGSSTGSMPSRSTPGGVRSSPGGLVRLEHWSADSRVPGRESAEPGAGPGQSSLVRPRPPRAELLHQASPRWRPGTAVSHDHGSGRVVLGGRQGWSMEPADDPVDRRVAARAHVELAACTATRARRRSSPSTVNARRWRGATTSTPTSRVLEAAPVDESPPTRRTGSGPAGSAPDPSTSVADGRGELHDTRGVWVGDARALPTATGSTR